MHRHTRVYWRGERKRNGRERKNLRASRGEREREREDEKLTEESVSQEEKEDRN